jgi:hypothetical protein
VWSPDSRRLLARDGSDGAYVFDVVEGTRHRYGTRGGGLVSGAFAPDGRRLLLAYGGTDRELPTLHLLRIGKSGRRDLWTGTDPACGDRGIVAWGEQGIRYSRRPDTPPHYVSRVNGRPAAVSGSGRRVLVIEQGYFGPPHAFLVNPLEERVRRLPQSFDTVNGMSRDGRHVLGVKDGNVIDVATDGRVRALVNNAAEPSWNK